MPEITFDDFRLTLTAVFLRPLALVYAMLALTVVSVMCIFLLIILSNRAPEPVEQDISLIRILTLVVLLTMAALVPVAQMLYTKLLIYGGKLSSPDDALRRIRMAYITRAAVIEGAALFGLVVFLLAGMWGVLHSNVVYWVNLLPLALFLAFLVHTFPTRSRIKNVFQSRLRDHR